MHGRLKGSLLGSQQSEDFLLLPTLLRTMPRGGTFVELGALDGLTYSNTLVLERCFGWRGLLIEANPANFAKLQRSGRSAIKMHAAICREGASVSMSLSGGAMAAIVSEQPEHLKAAAQRKGYSNATVDVPCRSLSALMDAASLPHASMLSLDVEGSERVVLDHADPARFDLVLVESVGRDPAHSAHVHHRLLQGALSPARRLWVPGSDMCVTCHREFAILV